MFVIGDKNFNFHLTNNKYRSAFKVYLKIESHLCS